MAWVTMTAIDALDMDLRYVSRKGMKCLYRLAESFPNKIFRSQALYGEGELTYAAIFDMRHYSAAG